MNFTLRDGRVIGITPTFLGAEPAKVKKAPRKGLRPFADAEDLAKKLFRSLDERQRKLAISRESFPRYRLAFPNPASTAGAVS
jgi:hypothetical protein